MHRNVRGGGLLGEGGGEQGEEVLSPGPGKGGGDEGAGTTAFSAAPGREKRAKKNSAKRTAAVRS